WPEWAVRLPIASCGRAGQWVLQGGRARRCGPGAAGLGSLILVTCPHRLFLARQTMVHMRAAARLAAAFGLRLLARAAEPGKRARYYLAAWTCVALAFMGKAAPGVVLPLCGFGAWLLLEGRLGELRNAKLPALLLILGCVAAPWFVQEYARHGMGFFDRL